MTFVKATLCSMHHSKYWGQEEEGKAEKMLCLLSKDLLCACVVSHVQLCDPMDCSLPVSSVHGISQQEDWNGLPFLAPRDLSEPGIKPKSPASLALAGGFFTAKPPGKPQGSLAHQRYKPLKWRHEPSEWDEREGECRRGPWGGLQWECDLSGY